LLDFTTEFQNEKIQAQSTVVAQNGEGEFEKIYRDFLSLGNHENIDDLN
jgi:hypothetical protein